MLKPRNELSEKELKTALDECAKEPIHIPGSIQPHGLMVVICKTEYVIQQVSENINHFTKLEAKACIGKKLSEVFGDELFEKIKKILVQAELQPIQSVRIKLYDKEFDLVAHVSGQSIVIEFEIARNDEDVGDFYDEVRNFAVGMYKAKDLQSLYDHVVNSIRKVTDIDRVKLYKFDSEWNGSVIAESKADYMPSYLGMRFPASDIPEQARILYMKNYIRLIADVSYAPVPVYPINNPATNAPLDLSLSMLRSVSPVHIQYLANMNVRASMSISIIQNGKLWGLVACHHNSPLHVPYKARMIAEIIGHTFSAQLSTMENFAQREQRENQLLFVDKLNVALKSNFQLGHLLESTHELALKAMNSDGLMVKTKNNILRYGQTPDEAGAIEVFKWLARHQTDTIFSTTDAEQHNIPHISGGILSAALSSNSGNFVVWLRDSIIEDVNWAGNPEKPLKETKAGYRLTPRSSFALWKESVKRKSESWTFDNIDTSRNVINIILESEKLSAEQANIAKSEFLANMSHEIRTPMNAVIGLTNILSVSKPLTRQQSDFIKTLQTSADSLLVLINDLLDISKIEAREMELENIPFDMTKLIQEVISIMSVRVREKNLEFIVDAECVKEQMFRGDPTRIKQVVLNLCSNAVKFTDKGSVTLSVVCHGVKNGFERLEISVIDTGIGIRPEKQEAVFKKFEQADNTINRKYGGTGLGLSISKHLTEAMGGNIKLESVLNKGSKFTIELTLERLETTSSEKHQDHNVVKTSNAGHILLVEDYEPNVLVATAFLESFGYSYDVASSGEEAIDKFKNNKYHAILMDVQMHGLNGFQTTKLIREFEQKTKQKPAYIIGMTAHALTGDKERCLAAGMNEYISKPFNPNDLEMKLKNAV